MRRRPPPAKDPFVSVCGLTYTRRSTPRVIVAGVAVRWGFAEWARLDSF